MAILLLFGLAFFSGLLASAIALLCFLPSRNRDILIGNSNGRPISLSGENQGAPPSFQIVVLGDIGHSPRMQYHALSIAKHGGQVTLIGYQLSPPMSELISRSNVSILALPHSNKFQTKNQLIFPALAILKVIQQTWGLWTALAYRSEPAEWMLIQNPPAIPTLLISQLACWLRNTRLIVDWHNFGYSILAMKLGPGHPMVKIMRHHETTFGRIASSHFCVSKAMAGLLRSQMAITSPILVLHDRPPALFQPIVSKQIRLNFLSTIPETQVFAETVRRGGTCELIVSSTSWTPDEDFSLLLDALCQYSIDATAVDSTLPDLYVIITGKGPQRQMYCDKISLLSKEGKLDKITIRCAWLSIENYAKLLACSSLGVCLHTSSSGVDLPMKVVDMFGAGLPVVAWDRYDAWPELITEGVNGRGFGSAEELSNQLVELFGKDRTQLEYLRQGARNESKRRWDDEWDPIAGKMFGFVS